MSARRDAAVLVAACAFAAVEFAAGRHYRALHPARAVASTVSLQVAHGAFVLDLERGALRFDGGPADTRPIGSLVIVHRGVVFPVSGVVRAPANAASATIDMSAHLAGASVSAAITLAAAGAGDRLTVRVDSLGAEPTAEPDEPPMLVLAAADSDAFVPGVGDVADAAEIPAEAVVLGRGPRPLLVRAEAMVAIASVALDRLSVSLRTPARALEIAAPESGAALFSSLHAARGEPTERLAGVVHGVKGPARVTGLDESGAPRVRFTTGPEGRFELRIPKSINRFYASPVDTSVATSPPVKFEPGIPWDLELDVSEGGELAVRIVDADTRAPLTARLIVHGMDGTLDPTFGPDFRASGAGPLVDALRGDVTTPVPKGRYRVAATRGLEWSVDARTVDVASGQRVTLELAPRHVVPSRGLVGCDLHVHARPSFDTPVTAEDRVLSLVAAGVDFAVPTEHNQVGDYTSALASQGLSSELASVPGVEITTFSPRFGHFGVFPYPAGAGVPPFRATTLSAMMNAARGGDRSRLVQIHHPRLPKQIGYFETSGMPPGGPIPLGMRTDFDALEVYNGFDLGKPERVDAVMRDWFALLSAGKRMVATGSSDSHRIQYQWAGYPRTYAAVGDAGAGDDGAPVDSARVVAALKQGRSFVTSGPLLDVVIAGARPGDTAPANGGELEGRVVVRAAPWVDVSSLEIVVNGTVASKLEVPARETVLGPEAGSREEAEARTVRFDAPVSIAAPKGAFIVVVARGRRPYDDVLPFMPVQPLAFTNPIWVAR